MKKLLLAISVIGFSHSIVFAQYPMASSAGKKFDSFISIVSQAYVDTVNDDELVEDAIKSVLEELDPHSVYISKDEVQKMNEPLVGNFEGVGVQFGITKDTIVVISPITGGPSEKLGIQSGDKIIKINDKTVAGVGFTNQDVFDNLRGAKGTHVKVSIARRGVKKLLDFDIVRDKIPIYSIDASYFVKPGIGYIKINRFAATTMQEFVESIDSLSKKGLNSLILDLRGNSGGYLNIAIQLADQFLADKKLIVYTQGRSYPREDTHAERPGYFEKGKLVVLIDEGSASASEIVSGAVQDWDRALIIGRRSFGKGLVQKPYMLPDGSMIRLTISRYYTPTGRSIQKPYEEGMEDYYNDLNDRYKHGEFFSVDSIKLPDSLKYYTPNNRTVYGGGGIMPDIFVPIDTSSNSDYYGELIRKGVLNNFAVDYANNHRNEILSMYGNEYVFNDNFLIDPNFEAELIAYAEKEGIETNYEEFNRSKASIDIQVKALIARYFWKSNGFFVVINELNESLQKAIEVLEDNTFEKMKLTFK